MTYVDARAPLLGGGGGPDHRPSAHLLDPGRRAITATEDLRPNVKVSVISTTVHLIAISLTLILGWDLLGLTLSLLTSRTVDCVLRFVFYRRLWAPFPGAVSTWSFRPSCASG